MNQAQQSMQEVYNADYVSLHVRVGNKAALSLYRDTLGFKVHETEKEYYADKEDAYSMRLTFKESESTKKKKGSAS